MRAHPARHRFLWALGFALMAGLTAPVFVLLAMPWLDYGEALGAYAILLSSVAPAFYADSARRAAGAVALAASLSLFALILAGSPGASMVAAPLVFALARSGVASPRPLARAIAMEAALAGVALLFAALPFGGGLIADGLAVWCFWLVQSAHRALGAPSQGPVAHPQDPFVAARSAAERVMGQW